MKKRWVAAGIAMGMALGAFAMTASAEMELKDLSGQKLRVLCVYDESKAELFEKIHSFEERTGVDLEITSIVSASDLNKQITTLAISGDLPDVVTPDRSVLPSFASMGVLMDITEMAENDEDIDLGTFYEGPLNGCRNEGALYGLPFTANCLAVYYNKTILDAAGIEVPGEDWTWDDYKEIALACADEENGIYGAVMSGSADQDGGFQFYPWLWAAGGDTLEADSDGAREALTFLRSLIDEGAMSPEISNWTQTDAANQFAGGKAALFTGGTWNLGSFANNITDFEWGVIPYPKNPNTGEKATCLGGYGLCITNEAQNVEAAWEFIKFIESDEVMSYWNESSNYIPVRSDIAEASEYFSSEGSNISVYTESMNFAKSRGPHANFLDIDVAWQGIIQGVYTGEMTVDEAIAEFGPKIAKLVG